MIGQGSAVVRDVMPISLVYGVPACYQGLNETKLKRLQISKEKLEALEKIIKYWNKIENIQYSNSLYDNTHWYGDDFSLISISIEKWFEQTSIQI